MGQDDFGIMLDCNNSKSICCMVLSIFATFFGAALVAFIAAACTSGRMVELNPKQQLSSNPKAIISFSLVTFQCR
jgi:hypothetical protein